MALQPEIILTRPASESAEGEQDYAERSNFVDLLPSTGKKNVVGEGLFLV